MTTARLSGTAGPSSASCVQLYWLPLGAGQHVVRWSGRAYEAVAARRTHRPRCDLYHAALAVTLDGVPHVIETAPVWDRPEPDRGVVAEGPVGLRSLGRWRWFRYEVRRWPHGVLPDVAFAVDSPRLLSDGREDARRVLDLVPACPVPTWGRDEMHAGEMWNSNSLVAWLLVRAGLGLDEADPPVGGRAPGWRSGVVVARTAEAHRAPADPPGRVLTPRP
jgi:hypothetical protein